ncbi:MAG: transcription-repair coupling factor [Syntrophobacterales bacterium CG_4_8_14_3_um_filter_49_14]|nr:MAG: transcription-repair coupling factor [Syntrophobacterales bacterium CG23_combo_of_CG06-09_8_20_14_all_48_27]PJC73940.1 MAG: transcription-repair coupling factor [Syntrophobacterales bacterium CG_4_8_14_3_um_filter_49_14]
MRKIIEKNALSDPAFHALFDMVSRGEKKIKIGGLYGTAKSLLLSIIFRRINKLLVVVVPTEKEAKDTCQDISFFLGEDKVSLYPPWDTISLDLFTFQREVELLRVEVLYRLLVGEAAVVIAPLKALMQKVMSSRVFEDYLEFISVGSVIARDELLSKLFAGGYSRVPLVEKKGEFSLRGYVVDVFPPHATRPIRMEFMGDEVESIREFDPSSQRSTGNLEEFIITPAREVILTTERKQQAIRNIRQRANELELQGIMKHPSLDMIENGLVSSINPLFLSLFYESFTNNENPPSPPFGKGGLGGFSDENLEDRGTLGTLFDFMPRGTVLITDDFPALRFSEEGIVNEMDGLLMKTGSEGKFYLDRESSFLTGEKLLRHGDDFQQIHLEGLTISGIGDGENSAAQVKFLMDADLEWKEAPKIQVEDEGLLAPLVERIKGWLDGGNLVTILCASQDGTQRMSHLLGQYSIPVSRSHDSSPPFLAEVLQRDGNGRLLLREGKITSGFHFPGLKLVMISEEDIFGKKVARRRTKPVREGYFLQSFGELKEGDYVVHTDHGIGIYQGLQKLTVGKMENDFLLVEYQEGDKLYMPVDRLDRIQRYIGPEGYVPRIDRLGGTSWESVKERIKKSVREVAEELVSVYAARAVMERPPFSLPDRIYNEFSSTFEFEETPDQAMAIEDICLDMDSARPMDRLICGDAGFGKTEVALRASFRAVMDGKQVALLVPTTILAEQHYQTFSRRLKDFPVCVDVLNRFKTKNEQQKIIEGIRKGGVDIIIGTHRLLQKDIAFKDLGLVIIDEEQRFGVIHKEKLKKLRTLVDVLTLTATPIPRTMHLALIGIRDVSVINTPPEDRLPINVYVLEFNEDTIREAIRQELRRKGQVFFLHDRVQSIFTVARFVERIVPEARIAVVHGRMKGKEIEDAMAKFIRGDHDVLVCTTIISSGIDIPTANTIIINRADRLGLSQLYQLRGRVGRSQAEAYAYLLIPKGAALQPDARKRLRVIMDFSEPGSGFRIAMNDLNIRGGGDILGTSQSGHVSAVGYEMYTELMEKTIRELKGEVIEEEVKPEINLGLSAFIPEDYMTDGARRLVTYKRLSLAATDGELSEIREELADCYGFIPPELTNLLEVISIRNKLKHLKSTKMGYDGKTMFILFQENSPVEAAKIVELARKKMRGMRLTPDFKLYVPMPSLAGGEIIRHAKGLLQALMN